MTSSNNLNRYILKRLTQKLSDKQGKKFNSSLYAGITVKHFLSMLSQEESELNIYINKFKYDPIIHDYMLINSFTIKQEFIRKEFKEKIIIQINDLDDLNKISEDAEEFKTTYGYVIKTIIRIKTKEK